MNSLEIKERLFELGADLCNITSAESLVGAPKGFHPCDVLPSCKSVIVFAVKFLAGSLACTTTIPYTIVRNILSDKLDKMSVQFCADLESCGILAVPTGTIGPTEFDENTGRYRNIVSAKHAAEAAGMGVIGKNTLLITPEYGNMVWLSTVLTEAELAPDKPLENRICNDCNLCVKACPAHALGEPEMRQTDCCDYAFAHEGQGDWKFKCHRCRDICPFCFGTKNSAFKR